jgi:polysaccharide biosynthesis protein PslH
VTHMFPYPLRDGGRIASFNSIKHLSRRIEIVLASLMHSEPVEFVDELKPYCLDVKVHRIQKSRYVALGRGLFGEPPGAAARYYDPEFGKLIERAVKRYSIDVVELQHLNTAVYRPWAGSVPTILREHNVEYKIWERHAEHTKNALEHMYVSFVAPRVKAYEARVALQFNRCITVSEADARHLRSVAPMARIDVIPFGVDMQYFVPDESVPEDPYSMVLTGGFAWQPKQHNLRALLTEVFPKIKARLPKATLTVVGKGAPDDLRSLARKVPGVTLTGAVPDVRPYLLKAALALNYVESGGGIALKVLEAMAMRKAVLSNSLGCEGIKVQHGESVFLADSAVSFADAAVLLLENSALRRRIAEGGYQLVNQAYEWERLAGEFYDCYESVLSESSVATQLG